MAAVGLQLPRSRQKHAACCVGDYLYLVCGKEGTAPLRDVWKFHIGRQSWETVELRGGSLPCLQGHTAVVSKRLILIFGGTFSDTLGDVQLWTYNTDLAHLREVWIEPGSVQPLCRRDHSAVTYNNQMYIYGGFVDSGGASQELWAFNIDEEEWTELTTLSRSQPGRRYGHSAVVAGNAMWLYGGMAGLDPRSDTWKYSFLLHQWTKLKTLGSPPALSGHTACVMYQQMVVVGGNTQGKPINDVWCFNFNTVSWQKLTSSGTGQLPRLCFHSCVTFTPALTPGGQAALGGVSRSTPHLKPPPTDNALKVDPFLVRPRTSPTVNTQQCAAETTIRDGGQSHTQVMVLRDGTGEDVMTFTPDPEDDSDDDTDDCGVARAATNSTNKLDARVHVSHRERLVSESPEAAGFYNSCVPLPKKKPRRGGGGEVGSYSPMEEEPAGESVFTSPVTLLRDSRISDTAGDDMKKGRAETVKESALGCSGVTLLQDSRVTETVGDNHAQKSSADKVLCVSQHWETVGDVDGKKSSLLQPSHSGSQRITAGASSTGAGFPGQDPGLVSDPSISPHSLLPHFLSPAGSHSQHLKASSRPKSADSVGNGVKKSRDVALLQASARATAEGSCAAGQLTQSDQPHPSHSRSQSHSLLSHSDSHCHPHTHSHSPVLKASTRPKSADSLNPFRRDLFVEDLDMGAVRALDELRISYPSKNPFLPLPSASASADKQTMAAAALAEHALYAEGVSRDSTGHGSGFGSSRHAEDPDRESIELTQCVDSQTGGNSQTRVATGLASGLAQSGTSSRPLSYKTSLASADSGVGSWEAETSFTEQHTGQQVGGTAKKGHMYEKRQQTPSQSLHTKKTLISQNQDTGTDHHQSLRPPQRGLAVPSHNCGIAPGPGIPRPDGRGEPGGVGGGGGHSSAGAPFLLVIGGRTEEHGSVHPKPIALWKGVFL